MKGRYKEISIKNSFRKKGHVIAFVSIINFIFGLYIITSVISIYENRSTEQNLFIGLGESSYDYYFRIEYRIVDSECQPLDMFKTIKTIDSLQKLTNQKLNENLTMNLQILKINVTLESLNRIDRKIFVIKQSKLVCNYILELFVGMNFPSNCDNQCQSIEFHQLSLKINSVDHLKDFSWKFVLFNRNSIEYFIDNVLLYQTVQFDDEIVFIKSIIEEHYLVETMFDSNHFESSLTMSKTSRSLFLINKGLDLFDISSIYVSFSSLSQPNFYLRHKDGILKLEENDQSILFRQDATFKLRFNYEKETFLIQPINLPNYSYLNFDYGNTSVLILSQYEREITINELDDRFIFKIIPNK